jgi:hypothetical protein
MLAPLGLALLVVAPPATQWCGVSFDRWTQDGANVVWQAYLCNELPSQLAPGRGDVSFHVVSDGEGRIEGLYGGAWEGEAESSALPWIDDPRFTAEVRRAVAPEATFRTWRLAHAGAKGERQQSVVLADTEVLLSPVNVRLAVAVTGGDCPTVSLIARAAKTVTLFRDRCIAGEPLRYRLWTYVELGWSPDGSRLALSWLLRRQTPGEVDSEEHPAGMDQRSYLAIIPRRALLGEEPFQTITRTLSQVDLLDAGAGAKLDGLSTKLAEAGFRVAHRGKAGKARTTTEIFFAPGYRLEALEAARVSGADEAAVKPLTWKSPYPIVVAAGSER